LGKEHGVGSGIVRAGGLRSIFRIMDGWTIAQPGDYRGFSYLIWDEGWPAFERCFTGTGPCVEMQAGHRVHRFGAAFATRRNPRNTPNPEVCLPACRIWGIKHGPLRVYVTVYGVRISRVSHVLPNAAQLSDSIRLRSDPRHPLTRTSCIYCK
jgi:hypothetical protein